MNGESTDADAKLAQRRLAQVLDMADIAPLALGRIVVFDRRLDASFVADRASGEVRIGGAAIDGRRGLRIVLRHALELSMLLEICRHDPVLCGLAAARTAALFASLEYPAGAPDGAGTHDAAFSSDAAPDHERIRSLWASVARHQPGVTEEITAATEAHLATLWPVLGPAEYLMGKGGDGRLMLDPGTGLNAYGCSPRPRPWAVTFASSTASSISERGYAAAEAARRRVLRDAIELGIDRCERAAAERVRHALAACYELSEDTRMVLVPSGTDGELCAVAVAHLGDPDAPLTNLLVAAEETGTGVPLAAAGRHFATRTARGAEVSAGTLISGFPGDLQLVTVAGRTDAGEVRPVGDVNAECGAHIAAAAAARRRVLLHVMDQSKTGLVLPGLDWIADNAGAPGVDVVVDACQARLSVGSIGAYLRRGCMVLVTGSKFFTGPPFAGALLLPPALAARLDARHGLPAGLAQYCSHLDWPEAAPVAALFAGRANLGVALRWEAALAEMKAFLAVEPAAVKDILAFFAERLQSGIRANPDLELHDVPPLVRPEHPREWDVLPTVFTFSIRAPGEAARRRFLTPDEAREIYLWLNSDVSPCLPPNASAAERALASRLFHIGQPVPIATAPGQRAGALRISAGARLVSGEPSLLIAYAGQAPMARVEREIADALASLDKISLILRHLDAVRARNPRPRYESA